MTATPVPALPGQAFSGRALNLKIVTKGELWRRMYDARFPDPIGWGPGLSRFSDPTGSAFGIIYLGASAKVAFVETILRDASDGRGAELIVKMAEIERRILASLRVIQDLRLIDLTNDARLRMGVPSDVVGARNQALSRAWSAAIHAHPDQPDGVYFASRLNGQSCIALYDRALRKLEAVATPRLLDCRDELAAILDDLEIAIV